MGIWVSNLAGTPGAAGVVNGIGREARFNNPSGVAVDNAGNVFVADSMNHQIRKMTFSGTNDWMVTTLAGRAGYQGSPDGNGSEARFASPRGVAVDSAGNVYVADRGNNTIRKVTPAGVVTTLAGSGGTVVAARTGRGAPRGFILLTGVAVDSAGNVYVADTCNHTIRKVTPAGVVTTLAGLAGMLAARTGRGAPRGLVFLRRGGGQRRQRLCGGHIQQHDPQGDAGRNELAGGIMRAARGAPWGLIVLPAWQWTARAACMWRIYFSTIRKGFGPTFAPQDFELGFNAGSSASISSGRGNAWLLKLRPIW